MPDMYADVKIRTGNPDPLSPCLKVGGFVKQYDIIVDPLRLRA